jgi:hypothetical protein
MPDLSPSSCSASIAFFFFFVSGSATEEVDTVNLFITAASLLLWLREYEIGISQRPGGSSL